MDGTYSGLPDSGSLVGVGIVDVVWNESGDGGEHEVGAEGCPSLESARDASGEGEAGLLGGSHYLRKQKNYVAEMCLERNGRGLDGVDPISLARG